CPWCRGRIEKFDAAKGLSPATFPDYSPQQRRWERSHRSGRISDPTGYRTDRTTTPQLAARPEAAHRPRVRRVSRDPGAPRPGGPRGGGGTATLSVASAPRVAPYRLTRTGKDAARRGA